MAELGIRHDKMSYVRLQKGQNGHRYNVRGEKLIRKNMFNFLLSYHNKLNNYQPLEET